MKKLLGKTSAKKAKKKVTLHEPIVLTSQGQLKDEPALDPGDNVGTLPLDIIENEKEILIIAPMAGVDIDQAEIVINEDLLTIQGKRLMEEELGFLKNGEYYIQECHWGAFKRSVILPEEAEIQNIEASEKHHLLYIRIPKKPNVHLRIVKIKSK